MKKISFLQEIGVERARDMIDNTHVHLALKGGSEYSQLIQECVYSPGGKKADTNEAFTVKTEALTCFVSKEKEDPAIMGVIVKVLGVEIPTKFLSELRIGNMTLKFSKKERP